MSRQINIECKFCTTFFKPSRKWQVFCGNLCKVRWHQQHGDFCFYCGDISIDRDHVTPHSFLNSSMKRTFNCEYVKSCKLCNMLLSNNMFDDFGKRIEFLIARYTRRFKLDEGAIVWDQEEIDELGRTLKTYIRKKLSERRKGEEKVNYLNFVLKKYHESKLETDGPLVENEEEY